VEDHPAGVDDAAQPSRNRCAKAALNRNPTLVVRHRRRFSFRGDLFAQGVDHTSPAEVAHQGGVRRLVD
jgi:hypothetical protein